jgi:amino acid adenylation domain-containing protein
MRPQPQPAPFLESFSACAAATPSATALVFGPVRMTSAELNAASNRLSRHLRNLGVDREICVAIYLERGAEVIVAMLAIAKAHGFFLVLNPNDPLERLAWLLDDAAPAVVITGGSLADRLPAHWGYTLDLSSEAAEIGAPSADLLPFSQHSAAAAYMVYTSGSTGEPKGVIVPRGSLDCRCAALASLLDLGPSSAQLQLLNLGFDGSYSEVFPILSRGGKLVLSAGAPLSADSLVEICSREQISTFTLTPAYWHALMRDLEARGLRIPESVRSVQVGGDRISTAEVERWRRLTEYPARFVNLYGPTEATIVATAFDAADLAQARGPWLPIGTPLPGSAAYVVDDGCRPLPSGQTGQLFLAGAGLARGYHRSRDLTAERFLPDSLSSEPGARMYRTGDLARFDAVGVLHFEGRADRQLKIRGYRVEPAEIESLLTSHPSVTQAAVVARESGAGEPRLTAFVVVRPGAAIAAEHLRLFLSAKAPSHMEVDRVLLVDALLCGATGKVDRRALTDLAAAQESVPSRAAPRSHSEAVLQRIWRNVLRNPDAAMTDNFLELGGDSLAATQIAARAAVALELAIRVEDVFQNPTPEALASLIAQRLNGQSAIGLSAPPDAGSCAGIEQALLRNSAAVRILRFRLDGGMDRKDFEHAFETVLAQRPIPLLCAGWMNPEDGAALFAVHVHPAVCDAWSADILYRDVLAAYECELRPDLRPLPPPDLRYGAYAASQGEFGAAELPVAHPVATSDWVELPSAIASAAANFEAPARHALTWIPALALRLALSAVKQREAPVTILDARRSPPWQDTVGPMFRLSRLKPDAPSGSLREMAVAAAALCHETDPPSLVLRDLYQARAEGQFLTAVLVSSSLGACGITIGGVPIAAISDPQCGSIWADLPPVFDLAMAVHEESGTYRWALQSSSPEVTAEELDMIAAECARIQGHFFEAAG